MEKKWEEFKRQKEAKRSSGWKPQAHGSTRNLQPGNVFGHYGNNVQRPPNSNNGNSSYSHIKYYANTINYAVVNENPVIASKSLIDNYNMDETEEYFDAEESPFNDDVSQKENPKNVEVSRTIDFRWKFKNMNIRGKSLNSRNGEQAFDTKAPNDDNEFDVKSLKRFKSDAENKKPNCDGMYSQKTAVFRSPMVVLLLMNLLFILLGNGISISLEYEGDNCPNLAFLKLSLKWRESSKNLEESK